MCDAVPPDAPVTMKPLGAVRSAEPRVSRLELVRVTVKAWLAPATALAGATASW
jgi:hypothetical protein